MEVHGYAHCRNPSCEQLVETLIAAATGGWCAECVLDHTNQRLEVVRMALGGGIVEVSTAKRPQTTRNRRQHERRRGNQRIQMRRHASEKARTAAHKRLAAAAPELFALILADERSKRGLTPITTAAALQVGDLAPAWETLGALEFYRALASQENAQDAADKPPTTGDAAPEASER